MKRDSLALLGFLGLLVLAAVLILRSHATPVDTSNWKTLTNSCTPGTADDSPSSVASGVIAGKPFTIKYPPDWAVLQNDPDCSAILGNPLVAPRPILSVNGYGFVYPGSFRQKPWDVVYQLDGLTIHEQDWRRPNGKTAAIVSELLRGDHVEGIITLEYPTGFLSDWQYQALNSAMVGSFRPGL